jgi:hypothetical protein
MRVENSTLADPIGFYVQLIEFLVSKLGQVEIIFDGHNSRTHGGNKKQLFRSDYEEHAVMPPIVAEFGICAYCQNYFSDDPRVTIGSTIGLPVAASVYWASKARFFIAPWGAGMAKYRWAANTPGFVITNTRLMGEGGRLRTYGRDDLMEQPTQVGYLSASGVTDLPEAPSLVARTDPHRINFGVKWNVFQAELTAFIDSIS